MFTRLLKGRGAVRLLAALCIALPMASWAVDPTAEWCGDFPNSGEDAGVVVSEKNGYTISKNNPGNISTPSYMAVKSTGGWPMTITANNSEITTVFAYRLANDKEGCIAGLKVGGNNKGVYVNMDANRALYCGFNGNATYADLSTTHADDGEMHYIVTGYSSTDGASVYLDGVKLADLADAKNGNAQEVVFGAVRGPELILNGSKFFYAAVYDSKLSDSDALAAYERADAALCASVTAGNTGTAFDAATYGGKFVTVTGEEGGYLNVAAPVSVREITLAGEPFAIKLAAGATLTADAIDAGAASITIDVSAYGYDWEDIARNAVSGVPYRVMPVKCPSVTGDVTIDTSYITVPYGYSCASVPTAYGPALEFTTDLQFGSLNINFPGGRSSVVNSTDARVSDNATYSGLMHGAFPVIGTSWNDVPAQNATDVAIPTYVKDDGSVVTDGEATITLSGVNNPYTTGDNPGDRILYGYCDDGGSPVVTISNIPFEKYRVIAYAATDTGNTTFCPKTINGVSYSTVAAGSTATPTVSGGTGAWGASSSRSKLAEGVNYLVSDVITETTTVTINNVKSNLGRAAIPAVQIIEVGVVTSTDDRIIEDGGELEIDEPLSENFIIVHCDGDLTIKGTELHTVTEDDLAWIDLGDVTGTVTLGAYTSYTLDDTRTLPAEFAFGEGSTVVIAASRAEYGRDDFTVSGLTGVSFVKLVFPDETTKTVTVTDGTASCDGTDVQIGGAATVYDLTFANNEEDVGKYGYHTNQGTFTYTCGVGELNYDRAAKFNNDSWDKTTGLYLKCSPYIDLAASVFNSLEDFTIVLVGQMSPTANTIFLHLGSCNSGNGNGLLIATTETGDEVLIAKNTEKVVDEAHGVKAKVPNAATARHAYVISKSGSKFIVWVDGVKRGEIEVGNDFKLGSSGHSGAQVGSHFGGDGLGSKWKKVQNEESETGVVNVIRVFDYAVSDAQAEVVFAEYPYTSAGGLYTRTVDADADFSSNEAWAKEDDLSMYDVPVGATVGDTFYNPSATITVDTEDRVALTVNANVTLDKLTVSGSGTLAFERDGDYTVNVGDVAIIGAPVVMEYGAVDLSGTPVQINATGHLIFDCTPIDVPTVYTTTTYQLTGITDNDDTKIEIVEPDADACHTVTSVYNVSGSFYEVVVTPNHTAGDEIYYTGGYWGTPQNPSDAMTVALSDGTATAVFPNDVVVVDSHVTGGNASTAYVDSTLPANVAAIKVDKNYTFEPGVSEAILGGATVTITSGNTLTFGTTWHGLNLGAVRLDGPGEVAIDGAASGSAEDETAGTFKVSGAVTGTATLNIAAGKTLTVTSEGSIANSITLAGVGAELLVANDATVAQPTTSVEGYEPQCEPYSVDTFSGTRWYLAALPPEFDPQEADATFPSDAVEAEDAQAAAKAAVTDLYGADYANLLDYVVSGESGAWEVTVKVDDDVVEDAAEAALDVINDDSGTITIPAGLYYRITTETELGTGTPGESTQSDGTAVEVTKPGTTQGFIKVELSPSPIQ